MSTEVSTGEPRVQIQRYSDIHFQRTLIGPRSVKSSPETALGIWLPLPAAKFQVARGFATFVRDVHGKIHDENGNIIEGL